jgi:hypothetical protein
MRALTRILMPLMLLAMATPSPRAEPDDGEAVRALQHFLRVDCGVDGEDSALGAVLAHAVTLEAELGRLLAEGPDPAMLEEAAAAAQDEWDRRAVFLEQNPRLGLDAEALQIVLAITETEYLEAARQRVEQMVRQKAVVALAAIGSPTALQRLHEAFGEADEDLRRTIGAVLVRQIRTERGRPQMERSRAGVAGTRR